MQEEFLILVDKNGKEWLKNSILKVQKQTEK